MRRIAALLVVLVALGACARRPAAPSDSGVEGVVLLGPTCPVEQLGSPCPDRPMAAEIKVTQNGEVVTSVRSGPGGRFKVALAPGDYVLVPVGPNPNGLPFARPAPVIVRAHAFTDVKVMFDSGIR